MFKQKNDFFRIASCGIAATVLVSLLPSCGNCSDDNQFRYCPTKYVVGGANGYPLEDVISLTCSAVIADSADESGAVELLPEDKAAEVDVVQANATQKVKCVAELDEHTDEDKRSVTFRTNKGHFDVDDEPQEWTTTVERNGVAEVFLVGEGDTTVEVTASAQEFVSAPQTIQFGSRARATSVVSVTLDTFALGSTYREEHTAAVQLAAEGGATPAPGSTITLELVQGHRNTGDKTDWATWKDAQESVSTFRYRLSSDSDAKGQVSAVISAGETDYQDAVTLVACLEFEGGVSCSGRALEITAPQPAE